MTPAQALEAIDRAMNPKPRVSNVRRMAAVHYAPTLAQMILREKNEMRDAERRIEYLKGYFPTRTDVIDFEIARYLNAKARIAELKAHGSDARRMAA